MISLIFCPIFFNSICCIYGNMEDHSVFMDKGVMPTDSDLDRVLGSSVEL